MTASTKLCVNGRRDVRIKYISIIFLLLLKTIFFFFFVVDGILKRYFLFTILYNFVASFGRKIYV